MPYNTRIPADYFRFARQSKTTQKAWRVRLIAKLHLSDTPTSGQLAFVNTGPLLTTYAGMSSVSGLPVVQEQSMSIQCFRDLVCRLGSENGER
jgi:hypothetical protein